MLNLKDKSCIVRDYGLFTDTAQSLVKFFKDVYYYCDWQDDFPNSLKGRIGMDFDGIKRVQEFYKYKNKVDLIVGFDTYSEDWVNDLRNQGKRVWGAGQAESLELERWNMRKLQYKIGLPTQDTLKIKSLEDLELYFRGINNKVKLLTGSENKEFSNSILADVEKRYDNFSEDYYISESKSKDKVINEWLNGAKNKYVKSNMRGDIETFFAPDFDSSLSKFNSLSEKFGHRQDAKEIEFVIEEAMEGIEPGFDGIQVNGQFLSPTAYGYEKKGSGYVCRFCDYEQLPEPIKYINKKLSPILKKLSPTSCFFSHEFLIGKDKRPRLIDPTVRNPAPVPTAIMQEAIENLGEILWNGAEGKITKPVINCKYGAGVNFDSEWAKDHELEVEVDPKVRKFIKFRKAYKKGNKYYAISGFTSICTVIGLGNSVDEAINNVKKNMEGVKAYSLQKDISGLNIIQEEIVKGKKLEIDF